jgi:hypothetical protein
VGYLQRWMEVGIHRTVNERVPLLAERNTGGEWTQNLSFKGLNMFIVMYSFQGCENWNITSLCTLTACKIHFSIQLPQHFRNSRTGIFSN